ncbi:rhombosortase [Puniceicoccaceae bacterium K14]|nr:rhombosortase [Puniceicoccaceae bacterium K14]
MKKLPYFTLGLAGLSTLIQIFPAFQHLFQWDRTAIAEGEIWRIVTGHLSHWTPSHFAWDLIVFIILGLILEQRSRKTLILSTLTTIALSHIALSYFSEYIHYRGLSAIDTAFFAHGLLLWASHSFRSRNIASGTLSLIAFIGMILKTIIELRHPDPIFSSSLGQGINVATITHIAGLSSAILIQFRKTPTLFLNKRFQPFV